MKKPSFAVASGPVAGVRRQPEPRPSVVGFSGHSWQRFPKTVPQLLARPRVTGLGRRAIDPLGRGWTSRRRLTLQRLAVVSKPSGVAPRRKPRGKISIPPPVMVEPSVPREVAAAMRGWERSEIETLAPSGELPACAATSGSGISLPAILFTDDPVPKTAVMEAGLLKEGVTPAVDAREEPSVVPIPEPVPVEPPSNEPRQDEVWVQARDPKTLVVHWTADAEKRETAESKLGRGRWWVRLRGETPDGPVLDERPADGFEGSVILELNRPGREHVAELGYDSVRMGWHAVAVSESVLPSAGDRGDLKSVEAFGSGSRQPETRGCEPRDGRGAEAGRLPAAVAWAWDWWSGGRAGGSADWVEGSGLKASGRTEGAGAMGGEDAPAGLAGRAAAPTSGGWTQPEGARGRDFWFRVNAEVIVHGSTERDARVTVGGRRVVLRPDGSFSFRFALPDGEFRIPVTAVSRDGRVGRSAAIGLGRTTETVGGVGEHPMTAAWDGSIAEWSR